MMTTRREAVEAALGITLLAGLGCQISDQTPKRDLITQPPTPTPSLREGLHYPIVDGQKVEPKPYLRLPFKEADIAKRYDVSEGWLYSAAERAIHGVSNHLAVDLAVDYGTLVYAPCDGLVMSSYHAVWVTENSQRRLYRGKSLQLSLGYFVQIYNSDVRRFIQLAHLSDIDPAIHFSEPIYNPDQDRYDPTNHTLTIEQLINHPMVVAVKSGDRIGRVGRSGLAWGEYQTKEYEAGLKRPRVLGPDEIISWDESHIHLEECWRNQRTGDKGGQRDPYDLYTTFENYPTPNRLRKMGPQPLWELDPRTNLPLYAA